MIRIGLVDDDGDHLQLVRSFIRRYEKEEGTSFRVEEYRNGLNFVEDYFCASGGGFHCQAYLFSDYLCGKGQELSGFPYKEGRLPFQGHDGRDGGEPQGRGIFQVYQRMPHQSQVCDRGGHLCG